MIAHSFKLKIVLLSVLISGSILLFFGFFFLSAIQRIGIERIDRELQALGDAQVRKSQPPNHWMRFENSLVAMHSDAQSGQFVVKVNDRRNAPLYVSPRWPTGLAAAQLGMPEVPGNPEGQGRRYPPRDPEFEPPPQEGGADPFPPPPRAERRLQGAGPPPPMHLKTPTFLTRKTDHRAWRLAVMGNEEITLVIGMDLAGFHAEVRRFRNAAAMAAPIALLLLAAGGWLLAGQALRPVRVLTQVAGVITARGLDQRVPAAGADQEFQALIDVINGMLDRLEKSFQQATRFSADAAHELKTPLTILQGQLQQALQNAPTESAEQRRYAELLEEVQRLKVIVRKLLLLAQADSGDMRVSAERVNLSEAIKALHEDAQQMAAGLRITRKVDPDVYVMADPDLLRQALQNLASNAVKYNRADGTVEFRLTRQDHRAVFTISNTINLDEHIEPEHLFERFYRGDKAHGRKVEGAGLGLSLAREIARAHQGDLVLTELKEGSISFILTLPAAGGGDVAGITAAATICVQPGLPAHTRA